MNILIVSWQYPPDACGGTEIATRELARALARGGHHIEIVTTGEFRRTEMDGRGRVVVRFVNRRHARCLTYASLMTSAVRTCRQTRIDVVHAQALWMGPIALAIRLSRGIPYVLWGRGEDVRRPYMFGGLVRWASLRGASAVLALNIPMAVELSRHGARGVRVLGNGAGLVGLCLCSKRAARKRLGLPSSARVVVFVGGLRRSKGADCVVRAFTQISAKRSDAVLVIVGGGPLLKYLETRVQSVRICHSVILAGLVSHEKVGVYLSAADVFTLPSAVEGFPMSVVEAMAVGLPVVCSNAGALPDMIRDGVNGHVVRFDDADGLAKVLGELLDNPRVAQQMGRRNQAWAMRHSWDTVAERFAGICTQVVTAETAKADDPSERFGTYGIHVR